MKNKSKHFLTVERLLEYKQLMEERCYVFNEKTKEVIEYFYYYYVDNADEISELQKSKSMGAADFMINLEVIMDHPGVTFKDDKFIAWYSEQIIDGKL